MLQAFIRALQPRRLREHICRSALSSLVAALDEAEHVKHILHSPNLHCVRTVTPIPHGLYFDYDLEDTPLPSSSGRWVHHLPRLHPECCLESPG